jgi:hypothetical protein
VRGVVEVHLPAATSAGISTASHGPICAGARKSHMWQRKHGELQSSVGQAHPEGHRVCDAKARHIPGSVCRRSNSRGTARRVRRRARCAVSGVRARAFARLCHSGWKCESMQILPPRYLEARGHSM